MTNSLSAVLKKKCSCNSKSCKYIFKPGQGLWRIPAEEFALVKMQAYSQQFDWKINSFGGVFQRFYIEFRKTFFFISFSRTALKWLLPCAFLELNISKLNIVLLCLLIKKKKNQNNCQSFMLTYKEARRAVQSLIWKKENNFFEELLEDNIANLKKALGNPKATRFW